MSTRASRWTVEGDDGVEVSVGEDSSDEITIDWDGDGSRIFTVEDIAHAVDTIRLTAEQHPGVLTQLRDSRGYKFAVRIEDDMLYVSADCGFAPPSGVSWDELRKAIRRARKQVEARQVEEVDQAA